MMEDQVILLTALPVFALGWLGRRLGIRRASLTLGPMLLAWSAGLCMIWTGFQSGWVEPFGLLTPLILGIGTTLSLAATLHAVKRRSTLGQKNAALSPDSARCDRARLDRHLGASLGAATGLLIAGGLWTIIRLVTLASASAALATPPSDDAPQPESDVSPDSITASVSPPAEEESVSAWLGALAETAHHGFVKHLPIVGPTSVEVDALVAILQSTEVVRREFAVREGWDDLSKLESARAILLDEDIHDELQAISNGSVHRLYTLQKNEKILAFFREPRVQQLVRTLRPSTIAPEIEKIAAELNASGATDFESRVDSRRRARND